jgi:hypothetical protein
MRCRNKHSHTYGQDVNVIKRPLLLLIANFLLLLIEMWSLNKYVMLFDRL